MECGTCHKFTLGFNFYEALNYVHYALQQWLCKHHMHWLCVNVMIICLIEKAFEHWISIETSIRLKLTYTCEWNQEHEHEIWWIACQPAVFPIPDLTLKTMLILYHEQYNMVYEGNFEGNLQIKLIECTHLIRVLSCILYWIL